MKTQAEMKAQSKLRLIVSSLIFGICLALMLIFGYTTGLPDGVTSVLFIFALFTLIDMFAETIHLIYWFFAERKVKKNNKNSNTIL